jgi:signal transduction histidine kinase
MSRMGQLVRAYGLDVLIVLAAAESALEIGLGDTSTGPDLTRWLAVPAVALIPLPLLLRRRLPFAAPLFVWLVAVGLSFVDSQLVSSSAGTFAAGLAATFLLGSQPDARRARVGLIVAAGGSMLIVYNEPDHAVGDLVVNPVLFALAWLAGFAMRRRSAEAEEAEARATQAERERETAARLAAAEERARIARELHDVVAHAVSVMVLQVGAVRHKLPHELDDESHALRGVERTGRTALAEMRRLLGAMRRDEDDVELGPQPGLDEIEPLLEEVGRAGLAVDLHVQGERFALPRALDLSAYRIVQEGLTNVLKHASAPHADVTLRYAPDELHIEVRDDGAGATSTDGLGHGLVGIRERVKIYGGEMTAGAAPEGGFVLAARLPLDEATS